MIGNRSSNLYTAEVSDDPIPSDIELYGEDDLITI